MSLAAAAKRCTLENGNAPAQSPLPEGDESDMEYFLDQLQIALPVLGVNVLRGAPEVGMHQPGVDETSSPVFEIRRKDGRGVHARARQVDGEFTVLQGSHIAQRISESENYAEGTRRMYAAFQSLRDRLMTDGSIQDQDGMSTLTRDVPFPSPSTAGAIVLGRSCNDRQEWKTPDGTTFAAWEDRGLDSP